MAHAINLNVYTLPGQNNGFVARLSQAIADFREYLATFEELNALSDRELADIGLSRHGIRDVARDAVYGN